MFTECVGPGERAERYSVPGLFGIVDDEMRQPGRKIIALEFDRKYGYPTEITSNTTKALSDLSLRWRVTAFTPLTST